MTSVFGCQIKSCLFVFVSDGARALQGQPIYVVAMVISVIERRKRKEKESLLLGGQLSRKEKGKEGKQQSRKKRCSVNE